MNLSTADKRRAIAELTQSLGWLLVVEYLNEDIASLQDRVNSLDEDITDEQHWKDRVKLSYRKDLLNVPGEITEENTKKKDDDEDGVDPYPSK